MSKYFPGAFFFFAVLTVLTIIIMSTDLKELEATRELSTEVQAEDNEELLEEDYEDYDDYDDYLDDELNDTDMWDNATGGN